MELRRFDGEARRVESGDDPWSVECDCGPKSLLTRSSQRGDLAVSMYCNASVYRI